MRSAEFAVLKTRSAAGARWRPLELEAGATPEQAMVAVWSQAGVSPSVELRVLVDGYYRQLDSIGDLPSGHLQFTAYMPGGDLDAAIYGEEDDFEDELDIDEMTYEELKALCDAAGYVSKGASQAALSRIRSVTHPCSHSSAGSQEQCAICCMEFEAGEGLSLLPCSHLYHAGCVGQWLQDEKVCPVCKVEVGSTS